MDLKLTVTCEVDGRERTYDLEFMKDVVTLGRHSKNDVRIPDMSVGPDHARIEARGDTWAIVDLGTGPATIVDGRSAEPGVPVPLREGSEIRISSFHIQIRKPTLVLDESTSEKTSMVAMNMVREVLGSISKTESPPSLRVTNDNEAGQTLELPEDREYRIGRDADCDLILKHWSISRKHAMIRRALDQVTVVDLQSKNGVTVNGVKVNGSRILKSGDLVAVGHTEIRFSSPLHSLLDSLDGVSPPSWNAGAAGSEPVADLREETQSFGPEARSNTATRPFPPPQTASDNSARKSPKMILIAVAAAVVAILALVLLFS